MDVQNLGLGHRIICVEIILQEYARRVYDNPPQIQKHGPSIVFVLQKCITEMQKSKNSRIYRKRRTEKYENLTTEANPRESDGRISWRSMEAYPRIIKPYTID